MKKPTCNKCGLAHYNFEDCSKGIRVSTSPLRVQWKNAPAGTTEWKSKDIRKDHPLKPGRSFELYGKEI